MTHEDFLVKNLGKTNVKSPLCQAAQNYNLLYRFVEEGERILCYIIRSAPTNPNDSKFCNLLAQNSVHAAMAGKTDFVLGYWNDLFTLIPIELTTSQRKKIDINGELWWHVIEATRQPSSMKNP